MIDEHKIYVRKARYVLDELLSHVYLIGKDHDKITEVMTLLENILMKK